MKMNTHVQKASINLELVEELTASGASVSEIADKLHISRSTFLRHKAKNRLLKSAFTRGQMALMGMTEEEKRCHSKVQLVLKLVKRHSGLTFDEIQRRLKLDEHILCEVWVKLILEHRMVRPVWCVKARQYRYFPRERDLVVVTPKRQIA